MLCFNIFSFLSVRFLDIVDIILVATLLYQLYKLVKETVAIKIFFGIISVYLIWKLVRLLEMDLLSEIFGQFISLGVLALIVVFQPEIRRFLLMLGSQNFINRGPRSFWKRLWHLEEQPRLNIPPIVNACEELAQSKTGALIVITRENQLKWYVETGEIIEARISRQLLENIFFKNSPLHDGAVIISNNAILAARCVLPVSENPEFPESLGLRHRAAVGITEQSDAISLVVSEQTGKISLCKGGEIKRNINGVQLKELLAKEFSAETQASADPSKDIKP